MKKICLAVLITFLSWNAFSSGTYIVPPPRPKIDCEKKKNQDKKECQKNIKTNNLFNS